MKATKKPVTIDFIEWTGDNLYEVVCFVGRKDVLRTHPVLIIKTLEGQHIASMGDMIIQGVSGEFYPCKPDIFALTYDVEEV